MALIALLALGVPAALAEPVQQFSIQLKDLTADGRYSVVYTSNAFDTTGEAPPALEEASLRLATGMTIDPSSGQTDADTAKLAVLFEDGQRTSSPRRGRVPLQPARIAKHVTHLATIVHVRRRSSAAGRSSTAAPLSRADPGEVLDLPDEADGKGAIAGIGICRTTTRPRRSR